MNCTEARQSWMPYLDNEVDRELHRRIRHHLGDCSACCRWFVVRQRLEEKIDKCLKAGKASPDLWARVMSKARVAQPAAQRRQWRVVVGVFAAAAIVLLALLIVQYARRSPSTELARNVAEWHEQRIRENVHPDFVSTSDQEVDHYLKSKVPFRVHCPPRTDVDFTVQGAGVCFMMDQRQAAYIVGHVGQAPVSILVLDRAGLVGFVQEGFHHYREGNYQVASGVIADNVVVVIGTTSADVLDRLLNAYGSYPEG
jgi:hypothetical protein